MLRTVAVGIVFFLVSVFIVMLWLQLPYTRDYLVRSVESSFRTNYYGELHIGQVSGFIPFSGTLKDVKIVLQNEFTASSDTLISVESISVVLNPFDLLSNKLSMNSMVINHPEVILKFDQEQKFYTINRAFQRRGTQQGTPENVVRKIEVLSPFFSVKDGYLLVELPDHTGLYSKGFEKFEITGIELSSFIEFTEDIRLIDLQYLFAEVDAIDQIFSIKGQIYADHQFLEFNGFRLNHGQNTIGLTGEIRNIDILDASRWDHLDTAEYGLKIDSLNVVLSDYSKFESSLSRYSDKLNIHAEFNGSLDDIKIDFLEIGYGSSGLRAVGELQNLTDDQNITYLIDFRDLSVNSVELLHLFEELDPRIRVLDKVTSSGRISGSLSSTDLLMNLRSGDSQLRANGKINWENIPQYSLEIVTTGFDLRDLNLPDLPATTLNSVVSFNGSGLDFQNINLNMDLRVNRSIINDWEVESLGIVGSYSDYQLSSRVLYREGRSTLTGFFDLNHENIPDVSLRGRFTQVDLSKYLPDGILENTDHDFELNLYARGDDLNNLTGRINLDIDKAIISGDTLAPHQFYADLSDISPGQREFRFTSTLLDFNLRGDIDTRRITELTTHWSSYLQERLKEELLFDSTLSHRSPYVLIEDNEISLDFSMVVKEAPLVRKYLVELPYLDVDMAVNGNLKADNERLLINAAIEGSRITVGQSTLNGYSIINTMSLQHGESLKNFSIVDMVVRANQFVYNDTNMQDISLAVSMNNDHIKGDTRIGRIGNGDYGGEATFDVVYSDSLLTIELRDFQLGSTAYQWRNAGLNVISIDRDRRYIFDTFTLVNNQQSIEIDGVYSKDPNDLITVTLNELNLSMLSAIFDGRSSFSGIVNGKFQTSMLFVDPVISGDLFVDHFRLDNRTIGDISFNSVFNSDLNRFDATMHIYTDPDKYSTYLSANNNIGQNIHLNGWINAPDNTSFADTLFYFDVDLPQIDAWIITPIVPDVFVSSEGLGKGKGNVWGRADYLDFNASFEVEDIRVVTDFLYTQYTLNGVVELDRHEGISFREIQVRDRRNGRGVLNGNIGFNEFRPERPFNLTLDMSQLEFLNNTFDPDVPFYGTVSGSGRVSLTGSNQSPFLRTLTPVTTTSDSRLSIPLLDETSVEDQARFIQFVTSFSQIYEPRSEVDGEFDYQPENRFIDIMRMDLQFIAPVNSSVQLVFDPLTGEILTARGSGRIRITLEDQNFQMFGSFNVNSGEYVFVGGDIFVRRFQLRDGGTISWDGDPGNARLNITTAYRTRPNIGVMSPTLRDQQVRIPVDLMLVITGTIESIENDFYFEFPNATDVSQNATALSLLNSEDQKLIQATSLLFTGGFIPVGVSGQGQSSELGASIQARAGQVGLSQLLSNQINAILNSSLSNLDIDLNLTGFDQADIGIALRLFDDRLILRGESQYSAAAETGAETMLGDFGITYRINRSLSLEVFHRRDPTLRSIVGNQSQAESINGVGLEAQYQFNSWREFRVRFVGQIRRIFGIRSQEPGLEFS